MITFKQFLAEGTFYPIETAEPEEFIRWCETRAAGFLAVAVKGRNLIYRGMEERAEAGIANTNDFNRVSQNTHNYYTVWIDNNPNWRDYPKRAKSYIATTHMETANSFGATSILIPADNCQIGICSSVDLWVSFDLDKVFKHSDDMDWFMDVTYNSLRALAADVPKMARSSYSELVKGLKQVTPAMIEAYLDKPELERQIADDLYRQILPAIEKLGATSFYDVWVRLMNPNSNGFKHTTAAAFKAPIDREVWIQGEVGVVPVDLLLRDKRFAAFTKKYFNEADLRG